MTDLVAEMRAAFPNADLVDSQLRTGGEEGLTDAQLRRWLRARSFDPARAARDLSAHAAWRSESVPLGRVQECTIPNELSQKKVLIQGLDHKGRAVIVLVGGNHLPNPDQSELQRFYCYCSDAGIALADPVTNPDGKVVFILDVGDFGWRNFDLAGAKMLFKMVHSHYVERLDVLYFHNASAVVKQLFRMVAPLVDPATREKIVFLPHDPMEAAAVLEKDMDLAILPRNLGGSSDPRPVEAAWELLESRWRLQEERLPSDVSAASAASAPSVACTSEVSAEGSEVASAGPRKRASNASTDSDDAFVDIDAAERAGAGAKGAVAGAAIAVLA